MPRLKHKIKLSENQVRYLVRESILLKRNYDECLLEALLLEVDWAKLVSRGERQGYVLITHEMGGEDYVIVVSTPGEKGKFNTNDVKPIAAAIGESESDGWWRLKYLYSSEKAAAATPVALVGALAFFKKVIPDLNVSPAAEGVVKTYYQSVKDNSDLVKNDADAVRVEKEMNLDKPWLRAGYYPPPGSESSAYRLRWLGDELIDKMAELTGAKESKVRDSMASAAKSGFKEVYSSEKRTGYKDVPEDIQRKLLKALQNADLKTIGLELYRGSQEKDGGKEPWPWKWIMKNIHALTAAAAVTIKELIKLKKAGKKNPELASSLNYLNKLIDSFAYNATGQNKNIIQDAKKILS